jgi:peptidoglycan-associated lipoprotein
MFHLRIISYTFLSVFILTSIGCAPSTTKPDVASAGATGSTGVAKASSGTGEEGSGATRESNLPSGANLDQQKEGQSVPSPSSLDHLKDGKSTATLASGPLKDVLFEFDRYDLTANARDVLKSNADWLKRNASAKLEVEGHSDERGVSEYNLALGAKRSQMARDYLVTLGISAERITTISYGEEIPACIEANENCWRQNRRARFVVVPSRSASLDR